VNFPKSLVSNGASPQERKARSDALSILAAAVNAAEPGAAVKKAVDVRGGKIRVSGGALEISKFRAIKLLAFGKAAEPMARALSEIVEIDEGLVITNAPTRHEFPIPHSEIRNLQSTIYILQSSHPVPDESSARAGEEAMALVRRCKKGDLLFALISGGGSAMLEAPAVPLANLKATTRLLLASGCGIKEMNAVRKHLSNIKGGRLAAAAAARGCTVISLIISDVIGDSVDAIASGPTAPDPTTFCDAVRIAKARDVWSKLPAAVKGHLSNGAQGKIPETPKPCDKIFDNVHNFVIAGNHTACEAAAAKAKELGYSAHILTTELSGEAREAGAILAKAALKAKTRTAIICGGETTVTLRGAGKGGRNQETVLAAAPVIAGKNIVFASMGTDGIDGPTDAAGAICDGSTMRRAAKLGMAPEKFLKNNDSYNFFAPLGDLIITGPTGTNVMDIVVLIRF